MGTAKSEKARTHEKKEGNRNNKNCAWLPSFYYYARFMS